MGNTESHIHTANFDDIKMNKHFLINVMDSSDQQILIKGTLTIDAEVETINSVLSNATQSKTTVIIYGKNTDDLPAVIKRYRQLRGLGFNAFVYLGGLFEWLLLQEIYGLSEFAIENPTNAKIDVLKFQPRRLLMND